MSNGSEAKMEINDTVSGLSKTFSEKISIKKDDKEPQQQSGSIEDQKVPEKENNQGRGKLDSKDRLRGKRLFGVLLGTLNKCQTEAKKKSNGELKREEIEQKLHEKLSKEKEELQKRREEEKRLKQEKQDLLRKRKQDFEDELLIKIQKGNEQNKLRFIKTQTEPNIYFLPRKHIPETEKLINSHQNTLIEKPDDIQLAQQTVEMA